MWPRFLFASHQHIILQTFRPNTWEVQIWCLPGYHLHELHLKHATKTINISPTKQVRMQTRMHYLSAHRSVTQTYIVMQLTLIGD